MEAILKEVCGHLDYHPFALGQTVERLEKMREAKDLREKRAEKDLRRRELAAAAAGHPPPPRIPDGPQREDKAEKIAWYQAELEHRKKAFTKLHNEMEKTTDRLRKERDAARETPADKTECSCPGCKARPCQHGWLNRVESDEYPATTEYQRLLWRYKNLKGKYEEMQDRADYLALATRLPRENFVVPNCWDDCGSAGPGLAPCDIGCDDCADREDAGDVANPNDRHVHPLREPTSALADECPRCGILMSPGRDIEHPWCDGCGSTICLIMHDPKLAR
jgi:hypothetical protein